MFFIVFFSNQIDGLILKWECAILLVIPCYYWKIDFDVYRIYDHSNESTVYEKKNEKNVKQMFKPTQKKKKKGKKFVTEKGELEKDRENSHA